MVVVAFANWSGSCWQCYRAFCKLFGALSSTKILVWGMVS